VSKAGVVQVPNYATERILAAIATIPTEEFGFADVYRQVSDLRVGTVRAILCFKARQGGLTRVDRGRYRKGGTKLPQQHLPMAIIAEAVWAVLYTNTERKFMRLTEVVGEAETFIGRPGVSIYFGVNGVLSRWFYDGYLERVGKYHEYGYRLKSDTTERPVCRH